MSHNLEKTVIVVKPDVAASQDKMREVVSHLYSNGLVMIRYKTKKYSQKFLEKICSHISKKSRKRHYKYCGKVFIGVFVGHNAISVAREVIGVTDASKAAPHSIRGKFYSETKPSNPFQNFIYASSSRKDALREIEMFFGHNVSR